MDTDELRNRIVKLLENSFILRRPADARAIANELAKTVDLPVEVLESKVADVAKGLGIGVKPYP